MAGPAKWLADPTPTTFALPAGGTTPKVRDDHQPLHGSVGLSGGMATSFPDPGYRTPDIFTSTAGNALGYRESLPAVASLTIGTPLNDQDSDGDGLSDLVESGLGLDANDASPPIRPRRSFERIAGFSYQSLTFPRGPIVPPDAVRAMEVSGHRQTWTPAIPMATLPYASEARDTVSADAASQRFTRLKVTRPAPPPSGRPCLTPPLVTDAVHRKSASASSSLPSAQSGNAVPVPLAERHKIAFSTPSGQASN